MSTNPWVWIQAFLTLALFSIIFVDNGFYKFAEHAYVGLYAGYTVVVTWFSYIRPSSQWIFRDHKYHYIIPIIIGLLIYTRYIKGWAWVSRYNMAFMVGVGAGFVLARDFKSLLLDQVRATFKPLFVSGSLLTTINNIVLVVGVVSVMWYFLFTVEKKGTAGTISSIGRVVMMVAFGSAFGNTVMA
ncbi:MAG TPA: hypothetical protein GXX30_06405, partial [Firmicutes bacterium]|nr:hypothetical protein [Candidatus Fermentithermobacillaceae bacterium]